MKIIYIINSFPTVAETFVMNEIRVIKGTGIDVMVYPIRRGRHGKNGFDIEHLCVAYGLLSEWKCLLGELFRHPKLIMGYILKIIFRLDNNLRGIVGSLSSMGHAIRLFRVIIKDQDIQEFHVHAHFAGRTSEVGLYLNYLYGIEYTVTVHAADIYVLVNMEKIRERLSNAKLIIAISEYGRQFLLDKKLCVDNSRIQVVHCGIPVFKANFKNSRLESRCPRRILSVGRLVEKKGFSYLIKAMSIINGYDPDIELVIIGDGPLMANFIELTATLGLPPQSIRFLGALPNQSVLSWLQNSEVFVLPCVRDQSGDMDGIPVSLMEAMSYGVPVVSTSLSGIPELIIDEQTGLLVAPENPEKLANAIIRIFNDEELSRRLSGNGREHISKNFNVEIQAKKLLGLLMEKENE